MINVMQLIVNMPLMNVQFPPNAVVFYALVVDISNLDFVPTDWLKDRLF